MIFPRPGRAGRSGLFRLVVSDVGSSHARRQRLLANGKGIISSQSLRTQRPRAPDTVVEHIGGLFRGTLSGTICRAVKIEAQMKLHTAQTYCRMPKAETKCTRRNLRTTRCRESSAAHLRSSIASTSLRKTDLRPGARRCPKARIRPGHFESVTPNHHKLARDFAARQFTWRAKSKRTAMSDDGRHATDSSKVVALPRA